LQAPRLSILPPPGGCSLSVGWFVRSARGDFSKDTNLIFMKFGTDVQCLCQMSLLIFERSRSKFKVKTAGLILFCSFGLILLFVIFLYHNFFIFSSFLAPPGGIVICPVCLLVRSFASVFVNAFVR